MNHRKQADINNSPVVPGINVMHLLSSLNALPFLFPLATISQIKTSSCTVVMYKPFNIIRIVALLNAYSIALKI